MRILPVVRLGLASLLFAIALLAVLPAPTHLLWMVAIGSTELGHFVSPAALLAAIALRGSSRSHRVATALCLIASVLCATPLVRALTYASSLPNRCRAAFGEVTITRMAPIVFVDLFRGLPVPAIQPRTMVYSHDGGVSLSLDFYPAAGAERAPLVLSIHGGSWQSGDNQGFKTMDRFLAARGYAVADLNYRFAPRWPYPAASDDVRAAIAYLRAGADSLRIDPTRVVLMGRSAGAEIALDVAYRGDDPGIRGVISFYGPTDLRWSWDHPGNRLVIDTRGVLRDYLGGDPVTASSRFDAASAVAALRPGVPPTLLLHGGRDELVAPFHSADLDRRLKDAGAQHLNVALPWATHGFDFIPFGPGGQLSTFAIEWMLEATTRS